MDQYYAGLVYALEQLPPRTALWLGNAPHPAHFGAVRSVGLDVGQIEDYRFPPLPNGRGLHVQRFANGWSAHLDDHHPEHSLIEHARHDAPAVIGVSSAVIGAVVAVATTKRPGAAVWGAFLGGLFGRLLVPQNLPDIYNDPPNRSPQPTKRAKRRV